MSTDPQAQDQLKFVCKFVSFLLKKIKKKKKIIWTSKFKFSRTEIEYEALSEAKTS
jgi:hypothetical protein